MIKNIIFDIGMVLVNFHWEETMRGLGIPEEAIQVLGPNMVLNKVWHKLDLGIIPEADIIDEFKRMNPEYKEYIDMFFNNMEGVITMFDGADDFMKLLKQEGYKIYLLSNYPARMFELHKKRYLFYPYVDGEVISFQCHLAKPDPRIYEMLCSKYNLLPEECIFLDDRAENIEAAIAYGMQGIIVTNPYTVRKDLLDILHA